MSVRFRYVGPGGGGPGRAADQAGLRLPGRLCAEPTPTGCRIVQRPHGHARDLPCAVVRRGADLIECPDGVRYFGRPIARLFRARGMNRRVLYQEVP